MSSKANSPNVILLHSAPLSTEAIAELAGMAEIPEENLVLETNHNTGINDDAVINDIGISDDAVINDIGINDNAVIDDWFQAQPSASTSATTSRLHSGGKNIKAMLKLKSLRSPSPTPSNTSASRSTSAEDSDEDWTRFIEEEQQRRVAEEARRTEWCRRAAGRRGKMEAKFTKARELVSSLKGEEKSLRNQREALRAQLRALEEQEISLEKRKRSALLKMKKYESIVAKYKEMNI